jgi:hypothetical protein
MTELSTGRLVLIAAYDMQGIVYMDNRKGRKQARKDARTIRKLGDARSNGDRNNGA